LRKESGAAISPSEFANEAQKYFPQPGDTDSVIRQKQNARETAIKALEIQAGPGANAIRQMPTPKLDIGGAAPAGGGGLPSASDIDAEIDRRRKK
jgi:hypothetical protein